MVAELKEQKQLEDELTVAKHEAWILTDPTSKKIEIMPSDKSMPKVEAMWHPKMGIYVTAQQMPMPKNNKVLQLWLIPKTPGGKPMPSHVFWPDADGKIGEMVAESAGKYGGDQGARDHRRAGRRQPAADQHADVGRRRQLTLFERELRLHSAILPLASPALYWRHD